MNTLLKDEKEFNTYFEWKKKGFSQNVMANILCCADNLQFRAKYSQCMFDNAECRLCEKIVGMYLPSSAVD